MEIGFLEKLIHLIMCYVNSCSMQVLWNVSLSWTSKTYKDVRQGDFLSLYLFVLYIERLAHCIQAIIIAKKWKLILLKKNMPPIIIAKKWKLILLKKNMPPITYLFFTNAFILFTKVSLDQDHIIKKIV